MSLSLNISLPSWDDIIEGTQELGENIKEALPSWTEIGKGSRDIVDGISGAIGDIKYGFSSNLDQESVAEGVSFLEEFSNKGYLTPALIILTLSILVTTVTFMFALKKGRIFIPPIPALLCIVNIFLYFNLMEFVTDIGKGDNWHRADKYSSAIEGQTLPVTIEYSIYIMVICLLIIIAFCILIAVLTPKVRRLTKSDYMAKESFNNIQELAAMKDRTRPTPEDFKNLEINTVQASSAFSRGGSDGT